MSQKKAQLQEVQARKHSFTNPAFSPSEEDPAPKLYLNGAAPAGTDTDFAGTEGFYDDVGPNFVAEDDGTYDNEGPQEKRAAVAEDSATYDFLGSSDESDEDADVGGGDTFQGFAPAIQNYHQIGAAAAAQAPSFAAGAIDGYMAVETQGGGAAGATAGYMAVENTHVAGLTATAGYVAVEATTAAMQQFDEELSSEEEI